AEGRRADGLAGLTLVVAVALELVRPVALDRPVRLDAVAALGQQRLVIALREVAVAVDLAVGRRRDAADDDVRGALVEGDEVLEEGVGRTVLEGPPQKSGHRELDAGP